VQTAAPIPEPLHEGVALFNREHFFEAHESLEDVWRPAQGPDRVFLQALIHLAVGFYHWRNRNREGAARQLRKGVRKLAGYLPVYMGIDTMRLYRECLERSEDLHAGRLPELFPRIRAAR
jgi:hypothetical protein